MGAPVPCVFALEGRGQGRSALPAPARRVPVTAGCIVRCIIMLAMFVLLLLFCMLPIQGSVVGWRPKGAPSLGASGHGGCLSFVV